MDHPERRYTQKCVTPKPNFGFGVRFSPFLASQHRGGRLGKILKAFWKPNRVYTLLGISFLIQHPTAGPPHPKIGYSETEFRFRSKIFALFGISTQGGLTWKNSKSFLKTQQGIYVAGNIIFDSTTNRQTPPPHPDLEIETFYKERGKSLKKEGRL